MRFRIGDRVRVSVGRFYGRLATIVEVVENGYWLRVDGYGTEGVGFHGVIDSHANNGD